MSFNKILAFFVSALLCSTGVQAAEGGVLVARLSSGSVGKGAPPQSPPDPRQLDQRRFERAVADLFSNGRLGGTMGFSGASDYSTSTPETCSVTSDGVVTALKPGACVISATHSSGSLRGGVVIPNSSFAGVDANFQAALSAPGGWTAADRALFDACTLSTFGAAAPSGTCSISKTAWQGLAAELATASTNGWTAANYTAAKAVAQSDWTNSQEDKVTFEACLSSTFGAAAPSGTCSISKTAWQELATAFTNGWEAANYAAAKVVAQSDWTNSQADKVAFEACLLSTNGAAGPSGVCNITKATWQTLVTLVPTSGPVTATQQWAYWDLTPAWLATAENLAAAGQKCESIGAEWRLPGIGEVGASSARDYFVSRLSGGTTTLMPIFVVNGRTLLRKTGNSSLIGTSYGMADLFTELMTVGPTYQVSRFFCFRPLP